jgi:hypothetical protein
MFATLIAGIAAIIVLNQLNYRTLHDITSSSEYKGASASHVKQSTNGAETKLLTDIQRVVNTTQTNVISMNTNVNSIKSA